MAKKKEKKETPKVNSELTGFDIKINPFGEIVTSYDLDQINAFLNKNVDDKKLRDREDIKGKPEKKSAKPKKSNSDEK